MAEKKLLVPRRLQFSLRALLEQATFFAIGLACYRLIGEHRAALANACLVELAAICFGLAYGKIFNMSPAFALLFGLIATPLAFRFLLGG